MKQLLQIFLMLVLMHFSHAQVRHDFAYHNVVYTISIDTPSGGKTSFSVCKDPASCQKSQSLLWTFQKDVFDNQLIGIIEKFDSTITKTSESEKQSIADSVYAWSIKQFAAAKPFAAEKDIFKEALLKPSENMKIGVLILNTDTIVDPNGNKLTVEVVRGTIENGVIARRSLFVRLSDGRIFFNRQGPINFPRLFIRQSDKLTVWQGKDDKSVLQVLSVRSVFKYDPFAKIYYPENADISLAAGQKERDTLTVSSSLNNMIEMNVYTDLLGILNDKANGLIQTELAGYFVSNTGNFKNTDITLHNFMRPYLRLSRFDSKFRSMDSNNIRKGPSGDTLDRTYMSQVSYLQAGLKINAVRFGLGINQAIQLNLGADVNLVNADSLYHKDLAYFNYFSEINYTISRLRNFGMDATFKWSWQYLSSANNDVIKIANRGKQSFFNPMFNIFYYPSSDQASKIFFRFSYMANLDDGRSNYTQFQVGYKTSLKL